MILCGASYNFKWLHNWLKVDFYMSSGLMLFILLIVRVIFFINYILNSEVSVLSERTVFHWGLSDNAAFLINIFGIFYIFFTFDIGFYLDNLF
jgi:hypothetical protein